MPNSRDRWLAFTYAAAIFVGAFLLFQIQPLVSKRLLPWFGGSAAVWTTCLLFFQTVLFAGYAYPHASNTWLKLRHQAWLHMTLVVIALVLARALPSERWEPAGDEQPIARILLILTISIGLPYFVLSATGPLLQAWFARSFPGRVPYRLYALSNIGSLLALATYPFFFEPQFDLPAQALLWTSGFVVYAALCGLIAWQIASLEASSQVSRSTELGRSPKLAPNDVQSPKKRPTNQKRPDKPLRDASAPPPRWHYLLWLTLAAFGSLVLMSTTNHISTDIAVMPLLWIVPLALYLITFIITFDRPTWYRRTPIAVFAILSIYAAAMTHGLHAGYHWFTEAGTLGLFLTFLDANELTPPLHINALHFLVANFAALFAVCMICHGELVRLRPATRYLTSFYLMIAAGGALGGLVAALIAPHVFAANFEWDTSLVIACLVSLAMVLRACIALVSRNREHERRPLRYAFLGVTVLTFFVLTAVLLLDLNDFLFIRGLHVRYRARNFFGTLQVQELNADDESLRRFSLANGSITHGTQFTAPARRRDPTTYFGHRSGVGRVIDYYHRHLSAGQLRIGAVGLGTGTLAAYPEAGDSITFYEINPAVIDVAENGRWFTYLRDCHERGAHYYIRLGDARLSLQRELASILPPRTGEGSREGLPQGSPPYHLLILDAFSGDSVPVHLLTQQAFETYISCLPGASGVAEKADAGGAIAVHVSNRYLDLEPVVRSIALRFHFLAMRFNSEADGPNDLQFANWIVLTRNQTMANELAKSATPMSMSKPTVLWTDTRSSLFEILR